MSIVRIALAVIALVVGTATTVAIVRFTNGVVVDPSGSELVDEGITLMPTPVGFARGGAELMAGTPECERSTRARVFVVANRQVEVDAPATRFFTDRRAIAVRLGAVDIQLGPEASGWNSFVELACEPGRKTGPSIDLVGVTDFGGVWPGPTSLEPREGLGPDALDRFAAEVDAAIVRTGGDDVFVFVHGFDTTVTQNAGFAAELFAYLGRRGCMAVFAWPSQGSLVEYGADKTAARASVRSFRKFIELLGSRTRAGRIHILAHSAGSPIVLSALDELRLIHDDLPPKEAGRRLRLGRVVLAAPDVDFWEAFAVLADGASLMTERMTIYNNTSDEALTLAAWICGHSRLGRAFENLDTRDLQYLEWHGNVDVIDVTNAERVSGQWVGHRYFWKDPWVSTDVMLALATDATPTERGLVVEPGRDLYGFGDDYPERIPAIAKQLAEGLRGGARSN